MNLEKKYNDEYGVAYDSKRRFVSYWYQIREIISRKPVHVLEVGIGNGFVSRYVRDKNIPITTVDNNEITQPDIIADITTLPISDQSYDMVTAYEILEHISYDKARAGFAELFRVSNHFVVISIPDATYFARIEFPIPFLKKIKWLITIPFAVRKQPFAKDHEWEIGVRGYPRKRIEHDLRAVGFIIKKTYRVYENPYHRFYVLEKRTSNIL